MGIYIITEELTIITNVSIYYFEHDTYEVMIKFTFIIVPIFLKTYFNLDIFNDVCNHILPNNQFLINFFLKIWIFLIHFFRNICKSYHLIFFFKPQLKIH